MSRSRMNGSVVLLGVTLFALAVACGGAATMAVEGSDERLRSEPKAVLDWASRTGEVAALGWTAEFCEGDAPLLCVARDGAYVGSVELLRWPLHEVPAAAAVLARGGSVYQALAFAAADLLGVLEADRRIGYGPGYTTVGDVPAVLAVSGGSGLRSGYSGIFEGRVRERTIQYRVILGDTVFLLSATAVETPMEGEFRIADLGAALPVLDRVAAASRFGF
jgi:hypothetical protein